MVRTFLLDISDRLENSSMEIPPIDKQVFSIHIYRTTVIPEHKHKFHNLRAFHHYLVEHMPGKTMLLIQKDLDGKCRKKMKKL